MLADPGRSFDEFRYSVQYYGLVLMLIHVVSLYGFNVCCDVIDFSVPALPVKNLTGSGPVHPALAGHTVLNTHICVYHVCLYSYLISFSLSLCSCFRDDWYPDVCRWPPCVFDSSP